MKYCSENNSCRNHKNKIRFFTGSLLWVSHSHLLNFWSSWIYLKINSIFWHFLFDWALLAAGCSCRPLEFGHGNFLLFLPIEIPVRTALESVRTGVGSQLRPGQGLRQLLRLFCTSCSVGLEASRAFAPLLAQRGQKGSSQMITVLSYLVSFLAQILS